MCHELELAHTLHLFKVSIEIYAFIFFLFSFPFLVHRQRKGKTLRVAKKLILLKI